MLLSPNITSSGSNGGKIESVVMIAADCDRRLLKLNVILHSITNHLSLSPPTGTLRMFQTHACQGENLRLNCPKNSAISIYSAHFGGLRAAQDPSRLCPHASLEFNSLGESRLDSIGSDLSNEIRSNATVRCSSVQAFRIVDSKCRDNRTCTIPATVSEFLTQPNLTLIAEQEARRLRQSTEVMIDLCSSEYTYAEVMYKCKPSK